MVSVLFYAKKSPSDIRKCDTGYDKKYDYQQCCEWPRERGAFHVKSEHGADNNEERRPKEQDDSEQDSRCPWYPYLALCLALKVSGALVHEF